MTTFDFEINSEAEAWTLANALIIAKERYLDNAKVMDKAGHPSLVEQFERQASDVLTIHDRLVDQLSAEPVDLG